MMDDDCGHTDNTDSFDDDCLFCFYPVERPTYPGGPSDPARRNRGLMYKCQCVFLAHDDCVRQWVRHTPHCPVCWMSVVHIPDPVATLAVYVPRADDPVVIVNPIVDPIVDPHERPRRLDNPGDGVRRAVSAPTQRLRGRPRYRYVDRIVWSGTCLLFGGVAMGVLYWLTRQPPVHRTELSYNYYYYDGTS